MMNEYFYYLTERNNILEKSPDDHPRDNVLNPKNPALLLTNDLPSEQERGIYQRPLDDLTPDDYREQGYSVLALYTEREQQADPDTGELRTVITRQEILPLPKYGSNGPLPQYNELLIRKEVNDWDNDLPPESKAKTAQRNESRLQRDWEDHQLIAEGKMYQVNIYDIYHNKKEATYHNVRESDLNQIRKQDKIREFLPRNPERPEEGYPDFETFQRKYQERFGLERPMFLLSHPTLVEEEKTGKPVLTLDMEVNPARRRDLGKTGMEQFLLSQIATQQGEDKAQELTRYAQKRQLFWSVQIDPEELTQGDPVNAIKFAYMTPEMDHFETLTPTNSVPPKNANPNRYKPLFSLTTDLCLYAEKLAHNGKYTGMTLRELGKDILQHASAEEFDLQREWQNRRISRTCKDPEFLERVLRSGHSMLNKNTKEAVVPVIGNDGEFMGAVDVIAYGWEPGIMNQAAEWEKAHPGKGDYPEPVRQTVLHRIYRNQDSSWNLSNLGSDACWISPGDISEFCHRITFYPQTPQELKEHPEYTSDTVYIPSAVTHAQKESASWGLDTMDRLIQKDWSQIDTERAISMKQEAEAKWEARKAELDQTEKEARENWEEVKAEMNVFEEDFYHLYGAYQNYQDAQKSDKKTEEEKTEEEKEDAKQNWELAKAESIWSEEEIHMLCQTYQAVETAHNTNAKETEDKIYGKYKSKQFIGDIIYPVEAGLGSKDKDKINNGKETKNVNIELYQNAVYGRVPVKLDGKAVIGENGYPVGYQIVELKNPEEQKALQDKLGLSEDDLLEARKLAFRKYTYHHHRQMVENPQARQYQSDLNLSNKDLGKIWVTEGITTYKEMFPKEKKPESYLPRQTKGQISMFSLPEVQKQINQAKDKPFFGEGKTISEEVEEEKYSRPKASEPEHSSHSSKTSRKNRLGNHGL